MKKGYGSYVKFIMYLAIIVLVNLAGLTLFARFDLTANKIYSLSDASKKVVSTLSEPLTVNVFFTRNLPAPYNTIERYLHDLLEEYALSANRHFNYRFFDVSTEESGVTAEAGTNRERAKNYGIYPVQIQHIENDEVKFRNAYMGLVLIHGDMIERLPTITTTEGLEYRMTTAIQKLNSKISALLNLKDRISVTLYLSSSLEAVAPEMRLEGLVDIPLQVQEIVERLNQKNFNRLEYRHLDPTANPELEERLRNYHVMTLKWDAVPEAGIEAGEGSIGIVMEYGGRAIETPLLNVLRIPLLGTQYNLVPPQDLEEMINHNIESLIDINETLGYLADHGTPRITGYPPTIPGMAPQNGNVLSNFGKLVSNTYSIKEVNLGEGPISDTFNCLVIAGPTEPFTDYELYQIDQYLMRGKNLALFLDTFREIRPQNQGFGYAQQPTYQPLSTGLEKLLNHYGIGIRQSYVMDENSYTQRMPKQLGGGERRIYFAPIIKNTNINGTLDYLEQIRGFVTMKTSPLKLDRKRLTDQDITATELFTSSEKSWEMEDNITLNPLFIQPPKEADAMRSMPLAYVLEGRFSSYFTGKPIPEQEAPGNKQPGDAPPAGNPGSDSTAITEEGTFIGKGRTGKILLVASSEPLRDNLLDEEGKSTNAMLVMNLIDSLNGRNDIAVMRSKEQQFNPLHETETLTKTAIKTVNIAGLPVLVVLFGLVVWMRRMARKKRIEQIFHR